MKSTFPVISSILSEKELGDFIKSKYQIDPKLNCRLFRTGMNHTYLLTSPEEKYVIRVYSFKWRTLTEIEEEQQLLLYLHQQDIPVSYPIRAKNEKLVQQINAPEGIRYVTLFSFAHGNKERFFTNETLTTIGSLMAKFHKVTANRPINRISYTKENLLEIPYKNLQNYFSEELPEMRSIKKYTESFSNSDFDDIQKGNVHMDIWYDNMSIANEKEITLFDFDFCGNGWQVLDIGYFCKQLYHIESDKEQFVSKVQYFFNGYNLHRQLSTKEINLISKAGVLVFLFFLGVQAKRYDWSNIFLSENYLKMYIGKIQSWINFCQKIQFVNLIKT